MHDCVFTHGALVLGLLLLLCLAPSPFGPWDIDLLADALQGLLEQRENVEAGEVFCLPAPPLFGAMAAGHAAHAAHVATSASVVSHVLY